MGGARGRCQVPRLWTPAGDGAGRYLVAGDGADLCGQRLREGRGEEVLGALDAQVDDLPVELVILLLQAAVVLGDTGCHFWAEAGPPTRAPAPTHPHVDPQKREPSPHLLQPPDLLLQLTLPRAAVVLLQACTAAAAPPLLGLQLEELQMLQLLAQVLDQLQQRGLAQLGFRTSGVV